MNKNVLLLIPAFSVLLFGCNQSKEENKEDNIGCSCVCSCNSSEEDSSSTEESTSEESSSSSTATSFKVKFSVDTTKLDSWNPPASGYFIHAWGSQGGFDEWGKAIMTKESNHYYSYEYNIDIGKTITGVILAFKQGDANKQTVDINCNISSAGNYVIHYDDTSWTNQKMNASLEAQ